MSLRQELDRYLNIRRSLGYDLGTTERVLRAFICFAESQDTNHISTDLFVRWQAVFGHAKPADMGGSARHGAAVRAVAAWA